MQALVIFSHGRWLILYVFDSEMRATFETYSVVWMAHLSQTRSDRLSSSQSGPS